MIESSQLSCRDGNFDNSGVLLFVGDVRVFYPGGQSKFESGAHCFETLTPRLFRSFDCPAFCTVCLESRVD